LEPDHKARGSQDAPRNFNHGSLTVNVQVNGTPDDRLSIKNQGAKPSQIGVKGNLVTYSGLAIGTYSGGNGTDPLVVLLNSNSSSFWLLDSEINNSIFFCPNFLYTSVESAANKSLISQY
jgi:hypothetical protein